MTKKAGSCSSSSARGRWRSEAISLARATSAGEAATVWKNLEAGQGVPLIEQAERHVTQGPEHSGIRAAIVFDHDREHTV
ncbi:hypothetical protein [Streptosporangium saharense]|uniref:hypothetical protein n=1 Tax=Streptosporangium saharense TaxID=1706840 RepID=UPI0036B7ED15